EDTPEFYVELMKRCWDPNPKNRPTANEIFNCIKEYHIYNYGAQEKINIIESAETKRKRIIRSENFLSDRKNYKHHPESFYTSRLLNYSIEQAATLNISNISSIETRSTTCFIN